MDRRTKRDQARAQFLERGSKPTGKVSTGLGIGVYAEDVTNETLSEVDAELMLERGAEPGIRRL